MRSRADFWKAAAAQYKTVERIAGVRHDGAVGAENGWGASGVVKLGQKAGRVLECGVLRPHVHEPVAKINREA